MQTKAMVINMAEKKGGSTVATVQKLVMPLIEEQHLTLWDLRFEKEGALWILRVIIDKEGGVDINDCEALSRPLDKLLDEADPIVQSYCLEVSSAGLGREMTRDWHFEHCKGQTVEIRLIRAVDGEREFVGTLVGLDGDRVILDVNGKECALMRGDAAYIRLHVEF